MPRPIKPLDIEPSGGLIGRLRQQTSENIGSISKSLRGVSTKLGTSFATAGQKISSISSSISSRVPKLFAEASEGLGRNSKIFSSKLSELVSSTSNRLGATLGSASKSFSEAASKSTSAFSNAGRSISSLSSRLSSSLSNSAQRVSNISSAVSSGATKLFNSASQKITTLVNPDAITKSFSGAASRASLVFSGIGRKISGIADSVSSSSAKLFTAASRKIGTLATGTTKSVSKVVKNAPQIAARASRLASDTAKTGANVAGRVASGAGNVAKKVGGGAANAAGAVGNVAKGAGGALKKLGGPLLTTLLGGFAIADILGRKTDAAEMEGLTPEEKRERRRQEERGKTRGVLGVLGGIGGGALAGAGVGAALGAAGANPFTVAVGGVLGSIIGGIIGEEAVNALGDDIIDGVTGFAKQVGGFFSGLWQSTSQLAGDGWNAVTDFFGEKGPIQSTFRFIGDLPGNIVDKIKEGFSNISETLSSLPSNIWEGIKSGLSKLNPFAEPEGRFLGGAGSGMTLVGENGPELVNLGTASVVTPQSSFAGLGLNNRAPGPQINNIVINVNAPGANEFADQLSNDVLNRLEEQFNYATSLAP